MAHAHGQNVKGFTLLEAMLASAVLVIGIAAVTVPFAAAARNEQIDVRQTVAVCLGEDLMEEILALPFADEQADYASHLGPDPGEDTRAQFDNIDDYNEYEESPGEMIDSSGQPVTSDAARGLSRRADVEYVYVAGQPAGAGPSFVRITVSIHYDRQTVIELSRLEYAVPKP